MTDAIKFTLDGKDVTAQPGETIWEVAKREGTVIPHDGVELSTIKCRAAHTVPWLPVPELSPSRALSSARASR